MIENSFFFFTFTMGWYSLEIKQFRPAGEIRKITINRSTWLKLKIGRWLKTEISWDFYRSSSQTKVMKLHSSKAPIQAGLHRSSLIFFCFTRLGFGFHFTSSYRNHFFFLNFHNSFTWNDINVCNSQFISISWVILTYIYL